MNWLQIKFDLSAKNANAFSDLLCEAGAQAITFLDAADEPLFEPPVETTPIWRQTRVVGLFAADTDVNTVLTWLKARLDGEKMPTYQVEKILDQEWERSWMEHFQPMRFGQRLWICPSSQSPPEPKHVNLKLDLGLAFGTGTHETTALCLEWLDGAEIEGKAIIDYGCGSGILAIAALLLGASHAWALDIDPQAIEATQDNAHRNEVTERLNTDLCHHLPKFKADILLANILAGPLMDLAAQFAAYVRPGGILILSGILEDQANEVTNAYAPWFKLESTANRGDWCRITAIRH